MALHKNYPINREYIIPIGSTVKIVDGSYMFIRNKDGKTQHYGEFPETHIPGRIKGEFIVIGHGNYPQTSKWKIDENDPPGDTKIVHLKTGEVWYAVANVSLKVIKEPAGSKRVVLIPVEVPSDGTPYTIKVDVSYQMPVKIYLGDYPPIPTIKVIKIPLIF